MKCKRLCSIITAIIMMVCTFSFYPSASMKANAASDFSLPVNYTNIQKVGTQISGSVACACYAWAYCMTIVDGTVHKWSEYDTNGGKSEYSASCGWSGGNRVKPSTKSAALKEIYNQLNSGRPVCVFVSSKASPEHWVTVVGYTGVTNENSLSESNFLMIDPVNSKTLTTPDKLSSIYTLKTYDGKYNLRTTNKSVKVISSISIATQPTTTTYPVNGKLNTSGLTIKATYSDGTTKTISSGFTVSSVDMSTAGTKTVTVTYEGKTTTFKITVENQKYAVTFDASGGTVSDSKKTVTYGSTYGTLPTASRTGYTFDGWYTAASGGTKITADSKVSITANQTLYAHWKANSYTVTFDANGGTMSDLKTSVTYGSAYGTLPTPSRAGYIFMGWYTEASGGTNITADSNVETAKDHTLYAQWKLYKGDCDEDGELTENDLVMLQKWLLGSEELTNGQNADMNDDGNVDVFDMVELRRLFVLSNTSISLNVTSKAMITGDTFDLIATVSPENSVVEWSSSDTKIATVTDGKVKALSEGTAVIYASIDSGAGKVTVECKVTVSSPTIKLNSTSGSSSDTYIYKTNNNFYSMVVKLPTYTTNISGTVKWSVVSGDAVISGDKLCINQPGTITARASITYNGKTYSADYTYKRTQEFTADIPYNLRSKPSLSNSTILDSMPKGTKLTVSLIDYNDSTYVWGKVTYNNTTGYVLLWSKDGSDGGIKVV